MAYRSAEALEAGLDHILSSPSDEGRLELIVRRPARNEREVLDEGVLDLEKGLLGDTWPLRGSSRTADGSPHSDMQLNLMNARVAALVAIDLDRRALAGDQLYVDFDLSEANLPAGSRVAVGEAVIEFTDQPHRGCAKFAERFGVDALRFVNTGDARQLRLRGANAKVLVPGTIRPGDPIRKLS